MLAEQSRGADQQSAPREHLLGLIHCRRGDLAAGLEHLRRAADAEPANAAFRLMLARALIDNGAAREVLAMPAPPLDGAAQSVAMWQVRADAADVAGDAGQGRDAWEAVAEAR